MEVGADVGDVAFDRNAAVDYCIDFLGESVYFQNARYDVYCLWGLHEIAFEYVLLCEIVGHALGCALAAEDFLNGFAEP